MPIVKPKEPKTEQEITSFWQSSADEPVVSISLITYNHEPFVRDALNGILSQKTDFPFEVLVHDDASTDNTVTILKEYQSRYPNIIKPIYQKLNQYSRGRRIMPEFNFPRAKGKYIAICEGDDYWLDEQKISRQKAFLDGNPEYVICYTDIQAFDESGLVDKDFGGARRDLSQEELQLGSSIFTPTTFFRNVLRGWPRELANVKYGDIAIWSQLGDFGKGKYLPDIMPSMYRVHSGGVHSMAVRSKQLQMRLETLMALYSFRLRKGHSNLANKHLEDIFIYSLKLFGFKGVMFFFKRVYRSIVFRAASIFR